MHACACGHHHTLDSVDTRRSDSSMAPLPCRSRYRPLDPTRGSSRHTIHGSCSAKEDDFDAPGRRLAEQQSGVLCAAHAYAIDCLHLVVHLRVRHATRAVKSAGRQRALDRMADIMTVVEDICRRTCTPASAARPSSSTRATPVCPAPSHSKWMPNTAAAVGLLLSAHMKSDK